MRRPGKVSDLRRAAGRAADAGRPPAGFSAAAPASAARLDRAAAFAGVVADDESQRLRAVAELMIARVHLQHAQELLQRPRAKRQPPLFYDVGKTGAAVDALARRAVET